MCFTLSQELKHDIKAVKAGLSHLQMKYQQEFASLGENNNPIRYYSTFLQSLLQKN